MEDLLLWASVILVISGVLGTLLPVIPGTPLIFITVLGYAWYEGFQRITTVTLIILLVLMLITLAIDYAAGIMGAKKFGATKQGTIGAIIGGIIGLIFFSIPGMILGPLVGVVIGEVIAGKKLSDASRVGIGTLAGMAIGSAVKFSLAVAMAIIYFYRLAG